VEDEPLVADTERFPCEQVSEFVRGEPEEARR
jgi:hypothetical protein